MNKSEYYISLIIQDSNAIMNALIDLPSVTLEPAHTGYAWAHGRQDDYHKLYLLCKRLADTTMTLQGEGYDMSCLGQYDFRNNAYSQEVDKAMATIDKDTIMLYDLVPYLKNLTLAASDVLNYGSDYMSFKGKESNREVFVKAACIYWCWLTIYSMRLPTQTETEEGKVNSFRKKMYFPGVHSPRTIDNNFV